MNIVLAWIAIFASGVMTYKLARQLYLKYQIRRWKIHHQLQKHNNVIQHLYGNVDGFAISKSARNENDAFEYVYGEIEFIPFIALLSLVNPNKNTVFYDLGSGTGKAILSAAMVYQMKKCCGIEIFKPLHETALKQLDKLKAIKDYPSASSSIFF
jgi:tRNA G46 methylase TrmB